MKLAIIGVSLLLVACLLLGAATWYVGEGRTWYVTQGYVVLRPGQLIASVGPKGFGFSISVIGWGRRLNLEGCLPGARKVWHYDSYAPIRLNWTCEFLQELSRPTLLR